MPSPNIYDIEARVGKIGTMYATVDAQLRGVLGDMEPGDSGKQRRTALRLASMLVSDLTAKRPGQVHGLVRLSYARGTHLVNKDYRIRSTDEPVMAAFNASLNERLAMAEAHVIRNVRDVSRRLKLQAVAAKIPRGEGLLSTLNTTALTDKSGRRWSLEQYARMALATVAHEVLSEATLRAMNYYGYDLVDVSHEPESISSSCAKYDGNTYSLSGASPEYPKLPMAPPFHPGCEHFIYYAALA